LKKKHSERRFNEQ
jgi:hypothetical protein